MLDRNRFCCYSALHAPSLAYAATLFVAVLEFGEKAMESLDGQAGELQVEAVRLCAVAFDGLCMCCT